MRRPGLRGLSPLDPERTALAAARLMLERMRELIRSHRSFAFETTCAGRAYLQMLTQCKAGGWRRSGNR
jgi:predicted ABC-type ATPase